jgi:hypothetical protein
VNVKAQGLLHGLVWVRETFGEAEAERLLAACSPAVRDRFATAIAFDWIPLPELVEFLTVADQKLGSGNGRIAEAIGAASARANVRHLALRLAFFLGRPEFLMRRVAGVWRQYNDEGEMIVREFVAGQMLTELTGLKDPDRYLCASITGWLHQAGLATGMKGLATVHIECRAEEAARCCWALRWNGGPAPPA